jgi:LysM repeat protein
VSVGFFSTNALFCRFRYLKIELNNLNVTDTAQESSVSDSESEASSVASQYVPSDAESDSSSVCSESSSASLGRGQRLKRKKRHDDSLESELDEKCRKGRKTKRKTKKGHSSAKAQYDVPVRIQVMQINIDFLFIP